MFFTEIAKNSAQIQVQCLLGAKMITTSLAIAFRNKVNKVVENLKHASLVRRQCELRFLKEISLLMWRAEIITP